MSAEIQKLYIAYFNRPADPGGLSFWTKQLAAGVSMAQIANSFSASAEYQAIYNASTNFELVVKLYQNLFGRTPLAGEASWWSDQITPNGAVTITTIANQLASGTTPGSVDNIAVTNKIAAGLAYTAGINTTEQIIAYKGTAAFAKASAWLAPVKDAATLATAIAPATLNAAVADAVASGGASGQTFTLTTSTDTFTGTTGNDTFNAAVNAATAASNTLEGFDNIDGGAGTGDTLLLTSTGANANTLGSASIKNIELLTVRATSAAGFTGALAGLGMTTANNDRSTDAVTFTGLAAGGVFGIQGNEATTNGASNLGYAAAATAGTVNISGGTTAGAIVITGTGLTSQTINSTGAANIVGAITQAATTTALTINATSGLTSTGQMVGAALASIKVAGAASTGPTPTVANVINAAVNLGTAAATVTTIDASGMTAGGVSVGLVAAVTSFKGGTGSDVVTTAALTNTTASIIDAGAGTDVLTAGAYAHINTAALAKQYANFEVLDSGILTGTAIDMSLFTNSTITGLATGVATASSFSNVTAAQAANVTIYGSQATTTTIAVKDASVNGNLDTLTLKFNDGLAAVSTFTLASLVAAGVETLNVNTNDNAVISLLTSAAALNKIVVTGSGTSSITTGAVAVNANSVVDASAATGTFTFIGTGATANGYKITGSATKANTLTTAALDDILIGGTANDTFTAGAGSNTLTGGGGADGYVVVANGAVPSATVFHTITDFSKAAGTTTFDTISAAALIIGVQTAAAGAGVATITTGLATFNTADTTFAQHLAAVAAAQQAIAGAATIWQEGTDSYLFISDGILAVANTDILVKLTGVTAGALTVAANAITAIA